MQSQATVYVRGQTPEALKQKIALIPAILGGLNGQANSVRDALLVRVGLVLLMLIKEAFIVKARGGTDAAGIQWKPLSKSYVAYGRRHPSLPPASQRKRPGHLLTDKQTDLWWETYRRNLARFARREGIKSAKGHAAAIAWAVVKKAGGKTILGTYGDAPTEIGRDTGRLLNSLSPGIAGPSGDADQIFRTEPNAVAVGTNVAYAAAFHARRPLWKENGDEWPREWWDQINDALETGLVGLVQQLAA